MERDTLPQGSRKKLRSKILWEKELLWSDLQVAERRLALSEMNSDAVSYTYAAKGAHKVEAIKNQEANP